MSDDIRAAVKLVRQKVQRAQTALRLKDTSRAALEITLAEIAVDDLGHLMDEPGHVLTSDPALAVGLVE